MKLLNKLVELSVLWVQAAKSKAKGKAKGKGKGKGKGKAAAKPKAAAGALPFLSAGAFCSGRDAFESDELCKCSAEREGQNKSEGEGAGHEQPGGRGGRGNSHPALCSALRCIGR